jgi:nucleotide-binding universal stress UspA family protein
MKTILVPTDFSDNADNALYFAIELAKKQNAKLVLIHAFQLPIVVAAVPYDIINNEKLELKKKAENNLKAQCLKIKHSGNLTYEYILEEGDTVDVILKHAKEKKADIIIMGTKGASGLKAVLFGSITESVIEKTELPVLAIPNKTKFSTPIKTITFATNYNLNEIESIKKLIEIAVVLESKIKILHITDEDITNEHEVNLMNKFMKLVNSEITFKPITFQIIHGKNITQQLLNLISSGNTDMLVLSTHYKNFMKNLLEKNITKQVVLKTTIPIVAFHYNDKQH